MVCEGQDKSCGHSDRNFDFLRKVSVKCNKKHSDYDGCILKWGVSAWSTINCKQMYWITPSQNI